MKLVIFIALLLSIVYTKDCIDYEGVSKASECKDKLSKKDESDGYVKCCFVKAKLEDNKEYKGCYALTQTEYDDIKKTIEKGIESAKIEKLDCFSFYLKFGFLSIFFLFL